MSTTVGLLVNVEAKPGKEEEVAKLFAGALPIVENEPATVAWSAIRFGASTFGVFDAFPDDDGRDARPLPKRWGRAQRTSSASTSERSAW